MFLGGFGGVAPLAGVLGKTLGASGAPSTPASRAPPPWKSLPLSWVLCRKSVTALAVCATLFIVKPFEASAPRVLADARFPGPHFVSPVFAAHVRGL
jgi:hypothetical protein